MTPQEDAKTQAAPMCSELRCKGMYVSNPAAAEAAMIIPGDTTLWWCERTQTSIGPDQDLVHKSVCTPDRPCYRRPGGPA